MNGVTPLVDHAAWCPAGPYPARYWAVGYQCYKMAKNLNTKSDAHLRKIRSMTILLRIVQMVQVITTKTSQKRHVLLPVRFAFVFRNSPRSSTYHSGPRASREKLRKNWAAGHENIIWVVDSGTTHNWHIPLAHLKTSTPKGMRSRSNWHTKDLNLEEEQGYPKQGCLRKRGPINRARYANLTLNDPEADIHQDTLSIIRASHQCARKAIL
jgi:hypothetical protein